MIATYSVLMLATPVLVLLLDDDDLVAGLVYLIIVILVLIIPQALLLLVPIAVVQERPIRRRTVLASAIWIALPMAVLVLGFVASTVLLIFGEDKSGWFAYGWPALIILALSWIVWAIVFHRSYASENPTSFTSTMTRWLLTGSILGVVVGIPSHIVARHRDDCCAPGVTLMGIATGVAVALMSFGPGILFLYAKRIKAKRIGR
jgi:hypothetical protein